MWKIPQFPPPSTPKQRINVTSTTQNYASSKQQIFQAHLSSSGYSDILPRENTLRSLQFHWNKNKIMIHLSVCSFFQAATNTFPIDEGKKNRMRLSYPRTSMINACPVLMFFCLILFDSSFSTIISFFPASICHLWRWRNDKKNFESYFLRHYVSSNHFFL